MGPVSTVISPIVKMAKTGIQIRLFNLINLPPSSVIILISAKRLPYSNKSRKGDGRKKPLIHQTERAALRAGNWFKLTLMYMDNICFVFIANQLRYSQQDMPQVIRSLFFPTDFICLR